MTDLAFLNIRCAGGCDCAQLLVAVGAAQPTAAIEANHTGKIVAHAKFVLHKFAQAIGETNYQIRKVSRSIQLTSSFTRSVRTASVPAASAVV